MKQIKCVQTISVPSGVTVNCSARLVTVKGRRGTLKRSFKHLSIDIQAAKKSVTITKYFGIKKELAAVKTVASHIENMIKGVTYGFKYKMKSAYAHFPINMVIADCKTAMEIRNFLGEKRDRQLKMAPGVKVSQTGQKDEIQLEGNDIENVSKSGNLIYFSLFL